MFRFVISSSKILILFIITSAKCEHKNDNKCAGCHPSKRDANCQPPIGIVLNAKPSEIRANYAHAYAGKCNCSDSLSKLFFYPQHLMCDVGLIYFWVQCEKFSEFCVQSADGKFYTPAKNDPDRLLNLAFFHPLCGKNGTDCKTYMTLINFGGISNGNIVVAQGLSLHSQNSSHSHGTVWQSPNIYNSAMAPEKTGLLPVVSVSCHGCDAIRAPICEGKFVAHK